MGLVQNVTPSDKRIIEEVYAAGSREIQELVAGKFESSLDIEVNMQNGRLLEYLFGTVGHATTGADTKHTFTVGTTIPSFTAEHSFNAASDRVFIYEGCKINSASINLDTNGILKMSASILAQAVDTSTASASAAVISSLAVLHYKHSSLATGTAGAEASVEKLQTFNLNIENNLEQVDAAGTFVTQESVESNFKMAFDFTIMFEDLDEYAIFLGGTAPALSPTKKSAVFNAHNSVALGSGRREFYIQLDDFLYEEAGAPVTVGETVVASFKGTATDLGSNKCYYTDNIAGAAFS